VLSGVPSNEMISALVMPIRTLLSDVEVAQPAVKAEAMIAGIMRDGFMRVERASLLEVCQLKEDLLDSIVKNVM